MNKLQEEAERWSESEFTDMLADCPTSQIEYALKKRERHYIATMSKSYIKGATSKQHEIDELKADIELLRIGKISDAYAEDVIINLFTDKYSKQQKYFALGCLERERELFEVLIKKHQPAFYSPNVPKGERVMSFCIIDELNNPGSMAFKSILND